MTRRRRQSGSNWVKMEDVARHAGVSPITVSRAYRYPDKVAEETRKSIGKAAAELGYVPNLIAGGLASNRSRVIGLIVPTLANSTMAKTINGLVEGFTARNHELLLAVSGFSAEQESQAIATFLGRRPDGLVLTGNDHSPEARALIEAAEIPVVEVWTSTGPVIDMAVGISDRDAMAAVTQVVIDRGRRRIAYIDFHTPGVRRYDERRAGFLSAVRKAGLPDDLVRPVQAGSEYLSGRQTVAELGSAASPIDGLVSYTDIPAVGALFECQSRQWPVPDRIAVAGFGDYEIAAEVPPGLTTVRSHAFEMGWQAAAMLLDRLEDKPPAHPMRDVGFELVLRGST